MLMSLKPYLLRFHRWLTLVFAVPLAVLIVTGVILAVEPIALDMAVKPGSLDAGRIGELLAKHDPEGKTTAITLRAYEDRMTLRGPGEDGEIDLALSTGQVVDDGEKTLPSDIFMASRRLHEHFVFDQRWVVTASTFAMLALILFGVLMGWPRLRGTVSGWHQGVAWFGLPLAVLSPLTGLAIAYGVTFSDPPKQGAPAALPKIAEAVQMLGKEHDLSGLIWLRQRGPRLMARINEGGVFRVYAVSAQGVAPMGNNWPRALHEGNFAGKWSGLMVLLTALGFVGLMVTGLILYVRRTFRPRQRNRAAPAVQPAE